MKKSNAPLEKDIQNDICAWLESRHFFFWRQNNGAVFGRNNAGKMTFRTLPKYCRKGVPDIIVIRKGQFIGLEVKRPGQGLTLEQVDFQELVLDNGGFYFPVTSVNDVRLILE